MDLQQVVKRTSKRLQGWGWGPGLAWPQPSLGTHQVWLKDWDARLAGEKTLGTTG